MRRAGTAGQPDRPGREPQPVAGKHLCVDAFQGPGAPGRIEGGQGAEARREVPLEDAEAILVPPKGHRQLRVLVEVPRHELAQTRDTA